MDSTEDMSISFNEEQLKKESFSIFIQRGTLALVMDLQAQNALSPMDMTDGKSIEAKDSQ
jgi:hypothetical protein